MNRKGRGLKCFRPFLFIKMGIKQAGKEILKANFGAAFSELIKPSTYRNGAIAARNNVPIDVINFGGDGVGAFFSFNGIGSCLIAYENCPPLQAVCNKRALALINGIPKIKNSLGKPSTSSVSKRVMKLLNNPNPLQTRDAFLGQLLHYIDLTGYAIIVPLRPIGFEMNESDTMWIVPPSLCSLLNHGNELNFTNGGIDAVQIGGTWVKPEDVMIITDINPSMKKMVVPGAKIKSLELPINNIIGAYESESTLILHRGPTGIISSEISTTLGAPLPILDEEKQNIQGQFDLHYGLKRGQSHLIITNAAVKYHKTGFNISELGLHETIKNGTIAICDTIGYPTELMGIVNPTFNNKEAAEKEVYSKYIMPSAKNIMQQLGSYLLPLTETLYMDYSHLPEMQQDVVQQATALRINSEALERMFRLNMITYNRMMERLGEEPREGFDKYYHELKDTIAFVFDKSNQIQNNEEPKQISSAA